MPDIALSWNQSTQQADCTIANGGIVTGNDLQTAVLVSLFTDRRADPDYASPDGSVDRRGWWGDSYAAQTGDLIGSTLWQYRRAKKAGNTNLPLAIQNACLHALQWMIDDGVAATVTISAAWMTSNREAIRVAIVITRPNGQTSAFNYSWAWQGV
jgi:phage gp46-like protein